MDAGHGIVTARAGGTAGSESAGSLDGWSLLRVPARHPRYTGARTRRGRGYIRKYSQTFQIFQMFPMFSNIPSTPKISIIPKDSHIFPNISNFQIFKISQHFKNFQIFQNVPTYSHNFPNISKYCQILLCIPKQSSLTPMGTMRKRQRVTVRIVANDHSGRLSNWQPLPPSHPSPSHTRSHHHHHHHHHHHRVKHSSRQLCSRSPLPEDLKVGLGMRSKPSLYPGLSASRWFYTK